MIDEFSSKKMFDELIKSADRLCKSLDWVAEQDKKFCDDIIIILNQYSHDIYCMRSHLKLIKEEKVI